MTKESINLSTESRKPFLLRPAAKDYLWGGRRLNDEFAKNIDMDPLAETWECSTHPNGLSYIASGCFEGKSLRDLLSEYPEYLGTHPALVGTDALPILIKFIDADKDLSIQVHPSDEYANCHENGQMGKTEMWYVLDAAPGANLIYGLNSDINREDFRKAITDGSVGKYLQKVQVNKNDVFFIEPGIIHAIGEGVLIAEIQQSSDLTYRLYDYDRIDKNGNKRELHIEKALEVANLKGSTEPKQPLRVLRYRPGIAGELLGRCKYFEVFRWIINTERRQKVEFRADDLSFRVLLCINGCGVMTFGNEMMEIFKGDCFFVPANSCEISLHGKMQLLDVRA